MKIDIHIHCGREAYPVLLGNPHIPESHYQADDYEIIAHMNSLGIEKGILMSSGEKVGDGGLNNTNEICREIVTRHPEQLAWMCTVDPVKPETVYDRLKQYREQGAVGVGEVTINQWLDSPFLTSLFTAAQELKLPVLCHMSVVPGISYGVCDHRGLPLMEQVLKRFPDMILVGHSQVFWIEISGDCPKDSKGRSGFGNGSVTAGGRVVELMERYPNLYGDLSALSGCRAIMRDPEFGVHFCEQFKNRLFFGTDMTNHYVRHPLSGFLDEHHQAGTLSHEAWENIFYKNARKVFGI